MSERAKESYENGEKPFSKWTKEDLIDEIEFCLDDNDKIEILKKYPTNLLKELCVRSIHSTI